MLKLNLTYTITDYENLPESVHAELIGGQMYYRFTPNRVHQEVLAFLLYTIANYIDSNGHPGEVYPGPFAVKLFNDRDDTVEPDTEAAQVRRTGLLRSSPLVTQNMTM